MGGAGAEIILWSDGGGAGGPFNLVLVPDISTKSSNGARGGNGGGSGTGSGGGAQAMFDQNLPWLVENWASGKQFSEGLSGLVTNSKKQNPFPSEPEQPSPKIIKKPYWNSWP